MNWRASKARELLQMADSGLSNDARLQLLRRAALLADAEADADTGRMARWHLLDMHLGSNSEIDLVASFVWLLHDPSFAEDPYRLLWIYKWVAGMLTNFASITADTIWEAIDDLERRHVLAGLSTAPAAQLRLTAAIDMRLLDRLPSIFEAWQRNESGAGSDCAACRRDKRVDYFAAIGDHERALTEAKPILEGSLRCAEIPRQTYPVVLDGLLRLGRLKEASGAYRKGRKWLDRCERMTGAAGQYLVYLAVRGRIDEGCALLTRWFRRWRQVYDDHARYQFARGAALLFRSAQARRTGVVHLALPPTWSGYAPDGLYDVAELHALFETEAALLATRFDARNGNSGFTDELAQDRELLEKHL